MIGTRFLFIVSAVIAVQAQQPQPGDASLAWENTIPHVDNHYAALRGNSRRVTNIWDIQVPLIHSQQLLQQPKKEQDQGLAALTQEEEDELWS